MSEDIDIVKHLEWLGRTGDGPTRRVCAVAIEEIERLRAYAAQVIERLDRCPDETRAIDADLAERRKQG